ncbi:MAG: gliding motility-associated C-terminal domain-containing protein [Sphingobacteriaceae bacterium]|nr:gliding motility-associated C-terminal domain-containing protein [Sphingobacteriaceae bacterium]
MKKNRNTVFTKKLNISILFLFFAFLVKGQVPNHNIGTYTVTDCRAKFYDDGGPTQPYLSVLNTTTTHTFCIFIGSQITMTFNPSPAQTQIQAGDFISFYNGATTGAPLIAGPFTATNAIPPIVAPSGSLTVYWTENGNTVGHGWDAGWYSLSIPPAPPLASLAAIPLCNATQFTLNTSNGIACDSVKNNYFLVNGPITPGIATVIPVGCNNGTTNVIQVVLQNPLSQNCTYTVNSTLFRHDNCDSAYKFLNIVNTFSISDCPIQASITALPTNTVCSYNCSATLTAVSPATNCLNFSYQWNQGLPPTAGPHAVCPTVTTVYSCTMTELSSLVQTVITRTIYAIDPQINPVPNPTVCQSNPNFNLTGTPIGGTWSGPGITNTVNGTFCPACTGAGVKNIIYTVGNCTTSIQLTVIQISAGSSDAACLGAPPFTVSGGSPGGGIWYGNPNISSAGVFTPSSVGAFTVLYTVGPCTSTPKTINVTNAIVVPTVAIDLCKSQWWTRFYLGYGITPFGGRYSKAGPGITNNVLGQFSPSLAGVGSHIITYSLLSGCSATFEVNVLDIDVSPSSATTCPNAPPFIPTSTATPAGGTWSCITAGSIQNPTTGLYNPSFSSTSSHTDILVYTATNGCRDTLSMKAIQTAITADSLFFCESSSQLQLSNNLVNFTYTPPGGVYNGPGVSLSGPNYFFNPTTAGPGVHTVYYDNNSCIDSVKMVVYPSILSNADRTICSTHPTFVIAPLPPGLNWTGLGVTNPTLGIFDPSSVLAGNSYTVSYSPKSPLTCSNSAVINVYQFIPADINGLNANYCFTDNNITFTTNPPNGTLTAPATITNNIMNPSVVGTGSFYVLYTFGEGQCHTRDSIKVNVYPQLTATLNSTKSSMCLGESSQLTIQASGGLPTVTNYTYTWSHGLIPINNHNVIPNTTTTYTVLAEDGCSDPVTLSVTINVFPNYYASFVTTPKVCYGLNGQATVNITPSDNYSYTWNTNPVQTGSILTGTSGKSYQLSIVNTASGCKKDTSIKIPGYDAIKALFSPNPNLSCIPFDENTVSFIDLSNGGSSGMWTFDGTTKTYSPGVGFSHEFKNPGNYTVKLLVSNEGNCTDEFTLPICILENTDIFIPDIFSPNNDGANDVLFVRGNGIKELQFAIYDRWGSKVFESKDKLMGWDGTINGKPAEPGTYAYFLIVKMNNDKEIKQKGDVTLIR